MTIITLRRHFELAVSHTLDHASFNAHGCSNSKEFSCMASELITPERINIHKKMFFAQDRFTLATGVILAALETRVEIRSSLRNMLLPHGC